MFGLWGGAAFFLIIAHEARDLSRQFGAVVPGFEPVCDRRPASPSEALPYSVAVPGLVGGTPRVSHGIGLQMYRTGFPVSVRLRRCDRWGSPLDVLNILVVYI